MTRQAELFSKAKKGIPERYLLVNAIAKRVRQLQAGSDPLISVEDAEGLSLMEIALKEIGDAKLTLVTDKGKEAKKS